MPDQHEERLRYPRGFRIRDFIPILNSVFSTAGIDIVVVELIFEKEEVAIGFPQIESLEKELKIVERTEDFKLGGRYIASAVLNSQGRYIPVYVRFYITSDARLFIEDFGDNGSTLVDPEEIEKPELWKKVKKVIDDVAPWGPLIAKLILSYFGVISDPE